MSQELSRAHEPESIAENLISEAHEHLADARIAYLFTQAKPVSRGRLVLAKASRPSAVAAYLSASAKVGPTDFVVVFSEPYWNELSEKARAALVDHELCHFGRDEGEWVVYGHDLEEFASVIRRHGLWRPEVEKFVGELAQLNLFEPAK